VSLAFFGLVQWRQKAPRKPIIRKLLTFLTIGVFSFVVIAEILASIVPSLASLVHIGSYRATWTSGEGPWLAVAGLAFAAIGISLETLSGFRNLRPGTNLRVAMAISFVCVLIGRNYSWLSIGWAGHHLGVPSWYIPVVGNDVRSFFILWTIALLFQWRWPLFAYTVILTTAWSILVLSLITKTLLQSISLRTVDQLLGSSTGKFTTHLGFGLILTLIGACASIVISIAGLWQTGSSRRQALPGITE
jgi:hypothetical protein